MSHAEHEHHITPQSLLIKIFGALIFLTVFTVFTSRIDIGAFNVPLAMLIASTKAFLVVAFFMAVKWDNKVNALVIGLSVVFVTIFLALTLFDTAFRGDISNVNPETIMDLEREANGEVMTAPAAGSEEAAPADAH